MAERIESMVDNIGKVVYYVWGSHVYSCQIYGVTVTSSDKYYVANDLCGDKYSFYEEDEGKKWFWTREEAEAKLPQKQTDTISNGIRSFYDIELLEKATVLLPKGYKVRSFEEGENG
jgi:hypothetical protein